MSTLLDQLQSIHERIEQTEIPPELEKRLIGNIEEAKRITEDISARVHIEQIIRYIEWIIHLPWGKRTQDALDLVQAKTILDKHHYGLDPVKDRILEYLAVLKLNNDRWQKESDMASLSNEGSSVIDESKLSHAILARRAPILCLVGLVGTGKTTLAKSVAEAMGRRFVRVPFGGMSDALDLRGQSRVRPDAEIGLIMKGLRQAGSKNPVMLLDEIDRVAEQTRGDIMGVLVELLDPEQNAAFTDHFVDYPFDLSDVLFIATANNTTHIATAVLDRLEPIQMPSYSDDEKITIGKQYVLPQLMKESGLTDKNLSVAADVWPKLVRPLGYDAGIRSLERRLNGLCRKVARLIVEKKGNSIHITNDNVKEFMQVY
ncbi:AAA family ATPase [Patescibacteria group bacterium]